VFPDASETKMKKLVVLTVFAASLAGLAGCVTPTYTYDQIHTRNWTRESLEQRFPAGTSKVHVLEQLGGPFAEKSAGDLTRWDYVGGASGQLHVMFLFRNGQLFEKRFENF
jgi:outer membrane protein assembly factor BamE (lipoprotein component of BamABCDE complex)